MQIIDKYYSRIISLLCQKFGSIWKEAQPGHCMKLKGLPEKQLILLREEILSINPSIDCYVIENGESDHAYAITAPKLIELRNLGRAPLFALIPIKVQNAVEDSFNNAVFQDFNLAGIDHELYKSCLASMPSLQRRHVEEIIQFLKLEDQKDISGLIHYLIAIEEQSFGPKAIGNYLYLIGLLPDRKLLDDFSQQLARLNYNKASVDELTNFSKSPFERVRDLPLFKNTLQKGLAGFLKKEKQLRNKAELLHKIAANYPQLHFEHWKIPEIDATQISINVDFIQDVSNKEKLNKNYFTLNIPEGGSVKVKIRFTITPSPNQLPELVAFKILLVQVEGNSLHSELITFKKSTSQKSYREKTIEIFSHSVDVDTYYLSVQGLDEDGNVLNKHDEFGNPDIQKAWEEERELLGKAPDPAKFPYKKTSDSENFFIQIGEEEEDNDVETKKANVHHSLEGYFKYRMDILKQDNPPKEIVSKPIESSWKSPSSGKLNSTYNLKYDSRHHYQINISRKIKAIQELWLDSPQKLGTCEVFLSANPANPHFERSYLREGILKNFVPDHFLSLREKLFTAIKSHDENGSGCVETFDWQLHQNLLKEYLSAFHSWITEGYEVVQSQTTPSPEQIKELNQLSLELAKLDIAHVRSKLPNGDTVEAVLLSPIHPLRLFWISQQLNLFHEWVEQTEADSRHKSEWEHLSSLFTGELSFSNHPILIPGLDGQSSYVYAGELCYGWGLYVPQTSANDQDKFSPRQLISYFRHIFNIDKLALIDTQVNRKLIKRHIENYILQHPYVDKLVINVFNGGEMYAFADVLVELENNERFQSITYEFRLFEKKYELISIGQGFKELINPEYNQSEEAEAFSQASPNRLFPKLRYSINRHDAFKKDPSIHSAHITFIINEFSLGVALSKKNAEKKSHFAGGLIITPTVEVSDVGNVAAWRRAIQIDTGTEQNKWGKKALEALAVSQQFTANVIAGNITHSIPATILQLDQKDYVFLSQVHETSDWVVTLDKNIGPEIFDLPANEDSRPFLLDYIPGEDFSGITSFLTTHPTSEIISLMGPHFEEFGISVHNESDISRLKGLLEDLRAVSGSLILQINSSEKKAFEVIGTALAKRVLDKKNILENTIIIPIDLHQSLFRGAKEESKSRADQLLVSIDPEERKLIFTVLEIKCRSSISTHAKYQLQQKIKYQIENTINGLSYHFNPDHHSGRERLDRSLKNYELHAILSFYANRAYRYKYLSDTAYEVYMNFLNSLDQGYSIKFKQLGFIFDFSSKVDHLKEEIDSDFTCFTFGKNLMEVILAGESDLDTIRLEKSGLLDLASYFQDTTQTSDLLKTLRKEIQAKHALSAPSNLHTHTTIKDLGNKDAAHSHTSSHTHSISGNGQGTQSAEETLSFVESVRNSIPSQTASNGKGNGNRVQPASAEGNEQLEYDLLIGNNKHSNQYGLLGKTTGGKVIAVDLDETITISLFGVQGGGKSYSIGSVMEMVLKRFPKVNQLPTPLAGVIFHYSESMDYEPEFTSMKFPNSKGKEIQKLKEEFGAEPDHIEDVVILTPKDKIEERKRNYPSVEIQPIAFNSKELDVKGWMFLLGALNNDSTYIRQLKSTMRGIRNKLSIDNLREAVQESEYLTDSQRNLALQRIQFAEEYIDDDYDMSAHLKPGRLIIVDLRDEFIMKEQALGLFVIMLNVFSAVNSINGIRFNKFIVFDEAHKYMDNKALAGKIVEAIREMRHKGVSIMIASQDPPSLPNEIIELSSIVIAHKFNSPAWLKHIQKSITQLKGLTAKDMSSLRTGEAFLWASKATENSITQQPMKIRIRPRVTQHGGGTIKAGDLKIKK